MFEPLVAFTPELKTDCFGNQANQTEHGLLE